MRARHRSAKPAARAVVLCAAIVCSGCGTTPVATVEPFQVALRDVCISQRDRLTENTAQKIEANNLALRKLLRRGSQCPKPTGKRLPQSAPEVPPEPSTS